MQRKCPAGENPPRSHMLDLKKSIHLNQWKAELVVRDGNDSDSNKKSPQECWRVLHAKNNLAVSGWEAGVFMLSQADWKQVTGLTLMRLAVWAEQRCTTSAAPGELDGTAEVHSSLTGKQHMADLWWNMAETLMAGVAQCHANQHLGPNPLPPSQWHYKLQ